MKVVQYKSDDARLVLVGMVTNAVVCSRIAARWKLDGLFSTVAENTLGHWCVKHIRQYGEPIGRAIENRFLAWSEERQRDEVAVKLMEKFLAHLSDKYELNGEIAPEYVLDVAGRHFNKVRMENIVKTTEHFLEDGEIDRAEEQLREYNRVDLGVGSIFRPGEDDEQWMEAFDDEGVRPLVEYPGDLGEFVNSEMVRDAFVVFLASSKRGKSWWLLDLGYRAARQEKRVAFFCVGDMSRSQFIRRMGMRATRKPRRDTNVKWPVEYVDRDKPPITELRELEGLTWHEGKSEWSKIQRGQDLFRLSCHPNSTISVDGVFSTIRNWMREEWIADVIVIDYVDILSPLPGIREIREKINETWKQLRRMSQELHCLVVTATQANAASFNARLLGRHNFSDDRRKHDHVTAMLGINQTVDEKVIGVTRLNWIDRRDADFIETRQLYVASCLEVGCPAVRSCF